MTRLKERLEVMDRCLIKAQEQAAAAGAALLLNE